MDTGVKTVSAIRKVWYGWSNVLMDQYFIKGYNNNNTHQALCVAKIEKSHRNMGFLACENSPTNSLHAPFCFKRLGKLCGRKTPALVGLRPLRDGCKNGRKRCAKHTNKQTKREKR